MKRDFESDLTTWAEEGCVQPLLVVGMRGCGKTYAVSKFLNENGWDHIHLDYETDGLQHVLTPHTEIGIIIARLEKISGIGLEERYVIVVDGIRTRRQLRECLPILERLSEDHTVIAISSSHGVESAPFRMIGIRPLSFPEYLEAMGKAKMAETLRHNVITGTDALDGLFYEYMAVGGMPEAVTIWRDTRNGLKVDKYLREILNRIQDDVLHECDGVTSEGIRLILYSIPDQLSRENKRFMFTKAIPKSRTDDVMHPLKTLDSLGTIFTVPLIKGNDPSTRSTVLKVYCSDTGLLRVLNRMDVETVIRGEMDDGFKQGIVENTIFLEMIKVGIKDIRSWRSRNRAKVEFILHDEDGDIPIQIDIKDSRYIRSLKAYAETHSPRLMVHMSPTEPHRSGRVCHIPLYSGCVLPDILKDPSDNMKY